jgi:8-amino-7-oxononanoate synthase
VSFASNDYLGLSVHPAVTAAASNALQRWGSGSGASRLVTGSRPVHHDLEAALADHVGAERAVLFPSGYMANLGVLTTFGDADVLICSDERNHASIVDGARLARARVAVYGHADIDHLSALLDAATGPAIVVSDLVFSMDGDVAPIGALAETCRRRGALLVLDEAHAVLGPDPRRELHGVDVLRMGTLSKALGSVGGYVAGPRRYVELLENSARSYIFTTAPTPADAAAALAALNLIATSEGAHLVERLADHVERVAPGHESPIIPVVLGDEDAAIGASAALLAQGLWVPAIRPPTVAPGTARLRVTLSAVHTDAQVDELVEALRVLEKTAAPMPKGAPASTEGATAPATGLASRAAN